jgi:hypothetical protein
MGAQAGSQGSSWVNVSVPLDGSAGPSGATSYSPNSFEDGSFVVGSGALGTSVAGAVAGATNSFAFGSLRNLMPYVLVGGLLWLAIKHKKA